MASFTELWGMMLANPFLALVLVLVMGTIFVNGATDAANAIAEPIGTRAIDVDSAIVMSVIANFVGLVGMTMFSTAVADTMSDMVDFGGDSHAALIALAAAMVAIVTWSSLAWVFGIPTSESHALIAGLTGAALAVHGSFKAVNMAEWVKVIYGLVLSTVLGFAAAWAVAKVIPYLCRNMDRRKANGFFAKMQVWAAAGASAMHGAQDGQKFMSTAMLAIMLSKGASVANVHFPFWLEVACAAIMAIGTGVGGKPIIKKVGIDMVQLEQYQGFAAALSATGALLLATLTGLPVSTTHTSSSSMMGAGAAKDPRSVDWTVAKEVVLTWLFTFPGCGLIGFVLAKVFLMLF
ncbi:MAG: inorganic phosphate transporter [Atopobiaceae bacterium]|nr:inorganic phosphate transporter [Atopobiaceae bacterium]MDO4403982.1 inorganic phosphate transporter [Atopobiaceae bacterium]